jgi:hypothetical protein
MEKFKTLYTQKRQFKNMDQVDGIFKKLNKLDV